MTSTTTGSPSRTRRRRRGFLAVWDRHPAVPSGDQLTLGERSADTMRNVMGSWPFVFGALAFLGVWMLLNSVALAKGGFDAYPYILLNLVLSCVAALQGAILLIAAKRSDQIASQLAEHDFETDSQAFERIQGLHERLADLAEGNRALLSQNNEILRHLAAADPPDPT